MATTYPEWLFDGSDIPDPEGRAARTLAFADAMKHPKSRDGTLELTPWQRRIIQRIYGPSDEHGQRQVRTVFLLLPRGNRKTSLGAVMALSHAIGPNQVPNGEVISAAGDRSQARLAFDEAAAIIREHPRFGAATKIRTSRNLIEHKRSASRYLAISADGDMQHGKTPNLVLADELHIWKGFNLFNALRTGLNKVPGSLLVITTTAGDDPQGVCWELYRYACKVALGEIEDPRFLPILLEPEEDDAWDDEATWLKVNPSLLDHGFPDIEALRDMASRAKELPRERLAFEQLHLNRWPDGAAGGWIEMAVYDEGAVQPLDPEPFAHEECVIGVDMSSSYDMTAVVAAFRLGGGYAILPTFFLPEDTVKKRALQSDLPWYDWVKDGHLIATPGAVIDEQMVEDHIRHLCEQHHVIEIACDPHRLQRMMARLLDDGKPVAEFPQRRLTMHPAIDGLQNVILGRNLHHAGHPVLRWNVQNATVSADYAGNLMFQKGKGRAGSIDGCVASAMAINRLSADPVISIYDSDQRPEGLLFL